MTPQQSYSTTPGSTSSDRGRDQTAGSPAELARLLSNSSRTFALSIPLLPEPLRTETTVAYLLFRVADTFEDEEVWSTGEKVAILETLRDMLASGDQADPGESVRAVRGALGDVLLSEDGYTDLLRNVDKVVDAFLSLEPEARRDIGRHLSRTIGGMCEQLQRQSPPASIDEVRAYCYHVAGIVGELLTDLFTRHSPSLVEAKPSLYRLSPGFGEALQLVNILRDAEMDADAGRKYIPSEAERAPLSRMAEEDLGLAAHYIEVLESNGADPGIVAFNTLNMLLARATLARVRELGPGAKISRGEVQSIYEAVTSRTARGESIAPLL